MSSGEGFLSRWSRRKLAPKPAGIADPAAEAQQAPAETAGESPAGAPEEPEFDVSTLTPLDELTVESDFTQFLQKGVPDVLRSAALRKMWVLDPILSAPDRFAEYAWDFNDPLAMPGFGPMEAGFDPSTMLRQIMGEKDPEAPEAGEAELALPNQPEEGEPPEQQLVVPPDPADGQIVADFVETAEIEMVSGGKLEPEVETIPLRRRHGGALPN
jgi:hypothetical protein